MNRFGIVILTLCCVALATVAAAPPSKTGWFIDDDKMLQENTLGFAITETVQAGIATAQKQLAADGGFANNPALRIPLAASMEHAAESLRSSDGSALVDELIHSMNRAAEQAAPAAADLLLDALNDLQIADPRSIIEGADDQITQFFRTATRELIEQSFRQLIHDTMESAGVSRALQQIQDRVKELPDAQALSAELELHIAGKALDAWYHVIAEQEALLRKDVSARRTTMVMKVFGMLKKAGDAVSGQPAIGR